MESSEEGDVVGEACADADADADADACAAERARGGAEARVGRTAVAASVADADADAGKVPAETEAEAEAGSQGKVEVGKGRATLELIGELVVDVGDAESSTSALPTNAALVIVPAGLLPALGCEEREVEITIVDAGLEAFEVRFLNDVRQ